MSTIWNVQYELPLDAADPDDRQDRPHYRFDASTVADALKRLSPLVSRQGEIASRCVAVRPGDGHCRFYAGCGDVRAWIEIPVKNRSGNFRKSFVTEYRSLWAAVQASGNEFVLVDDGDTASARIGSGRVALENFDLERILLDNGLLRSAADGEPVADVAGFLAFLKQAGKLFALADRPEERRIFVRDGVGYARFPQAVARINGAVLRSYVLRAEDRAFLAAMLHQCPRVSVLVREFDYLFATEASRFCTPREDDPGWDKVAPFLDRIEVEPSFPVEWDRFRTAMASTSRVMGPLGRAVFEAKNGGLRFQARARTGRCLEFPLVSEGKGAPVSGRWTCALDLLYKAAALTEGSVFGRIGFPEDNKIRLEWPSASLVMSLDREAS